MSLPNQHRGCNQFRGQGTETDGLVARKSALQGKRMAQSLRYQLRCVANQVIGCENIEIVRLYPEGDGTRSMMIHVTDPELLAQAGGIVQGMSGSPILQNGRLVGAVTHVLVNDPTRGYGILAENMLRQATGG